MTQSQIMMITIKEIEGGNGNTGKRREHMLAGE